MQLACAPLQISLPSSPAVLTGTQTSELRHTTNLCLCSSCCVLRMTLKDLVPQGLCKSCILLLSAHAGLRGERSNCKSS